MIDLPLDTDLPARPGTPNRLHMDMLSERFPELRRADLASLSADHDRARPPYRIVCDWPALGLAMKPDHPDGVVPVGDGPFRQWLEITRPAYSANRHYALIGVDFAFAATFAREYQCLLRRRGKRWEVVRCATLLMS